MITEIEELVEIAAREARHDFLIVPIPDYLTAPGIRREGTYLTGYTKVGPVQVPNPTLGQCCREVPLGEQGLVHADRVFPHVHES